MNKIKYHNFKKLKKKSLSVIAQGRNAYGNYISCTLNHNGKTMPEILIQHAKECKDRLKNKKLEGPFYYIINKQKFYDDEGNPYYCKIFGWYIFEKPIL